MGIICGSEKQKYFKIVNTCIVCFSQSWDTTAKLRPVRILIIYYDPWCIVALQCRLDNDKFVYLFKLYVFLTLDFLQYFSLSARLSLFGFHRVHCFFPRPESGHKPPHRDQSIYKNKCVAFYYQHCVCTRVPIVRVKQQQEEVDSRITDFYVRLVASWD